MKNKKTREFDLSVIPFGAEFPDVETIEAKNKTEARQKAKKMYNKKTGYKFDGLMEDLL